MSLYRHRQPAGTAVYPRAAVASPVGLEDVAARRMEMKKTSLLFVFLFFSNKFCRQIFLAVFFFYFALRILLRGNE